jgi:hypothetical protein
MKAWLWGDTINEPHDGTTLPQEDVIDFLAINLMDDNSGEEYEWMVTIGEVRMRGGRLVIILQPLVL